MTNDVHTPDATGTALGDRADPRWWVAPLVATLLAPLLSLAVAVRADLFTALPVILIGGFVLPLALVAASWFLARTRRRRKARTNLAVAACGLAAGYPGLLAGIGWTVFVVMVITGHGPT
ncbi:hypothetical protein ACFY8P_19460 [Streptomyces sp. NPDC012693]|uniref:hypothetical protein n=1 Tax=Streptomyces sp. NPDC012693 TaxID=3364844 RepID=UPI0036C79236